MRAGKFAIKWLQVFTRTAPVVVVVVAVVGGGVVGVVCVFSLLIGRGYSSSPSRVVGVCPVTTDSRMAVAYSENNSNETQNKKQNDYTT